MRYVLIFFTLAMLLWAGNFAYLFYLRPIDQPTKELRDLEVYFNNSGVAGHIYPVRHGFSHSKVRAVAAFEINGQPIPFALTACTNELEAATRSAPRADLPKELQPARNGTVVLDFSSWGDDTFSKAQSVRQAFLSYRGEP